MSTMPKSNLDDLPQIQTTYKPTMSVNKLKLCSIEDEGAIWFAGWQVTFKSSTNAVETSLAYRGLSSGVGY